MDSLNFSTYLLGLGSEPWNSLRTVSAHIEHQVDMRHSGQIEAVRQLKSY